MKTSSEKRTGAEKGALKRREMLMLGGILGGIFFFVVQPSQLEAQGVDCAKFRRRLARLQRSLRRARKGGPSKRKRARIKKLRKEIKGLKTTMQIFGC